MSKDCYDLLEDCAEDLMYKDSMLKAVLEKNKELVEENLELKERVSQLEYALGI